MDVESPPVVKAVADVGSVLDASEAREMPANDSKRLPGLDGIRAVAVLLVLVSHFYHGDPHGNPLERLTIQGNFGVTIFFVLSGYLITHLLLQEERSQGTISLSLFYARRAIRILPPLLAFLAALALANMAGLVRIPARDFVAGLFFSRNFVGEAVETTHLWTLAIEEQFYLIWPFALLLLRGVRVRIALCTAVVVLSPFWRLISLRIWGSTNHLALNRTDLNLDPLVLGALLALLLSLPGPRRFLTRDWVRGGWVALAATVVLGVVRLTDLLEIPGIRLFLPTVGILCVATIINCVVHRPMTRLARFLEVGILVWLGRLSYSLYLWQQPFAPGINPISTWFRQFPVNLLFVFGLAISSYYLVERPLFRMRKRFQNRPDFVPIPACQHLPCVQDGVSG